MSGYNRAEVMQKSCRCTWMYGELTEKEAVERVDRALDHHLADQFEILLYKKNRKCVADAIPLRPYTPHRRTRT